MPPDASEVTRLLGALNAGEGDALDRLFPLVYAELRRLAEQIRQGPSMQTMNTTALVHEAYLRLADGDLADFEGRSHFLGVAAKAMRHVLVDHARRRSAQKRGGGLARVDLTDAARLASGPAHDHAVLALDAALDQLAALDGRKARVVECRFFGDMSVEETAAALGVSTPTVKRDWRMAQAWLYRTLADEPPAPDGRQPGA